MKNRSLDEAIQIQDNRNDNTRRNNHMVQPIIQWSLNNRFIVIIASLLILGLGAIAATQIPLDAVPDLTNVQVQVLTNS
ncbi:MAG: efflux RND transporter permease subunit, partial [Planctomycetes bacterium]|nr:efflux RND transporter permease subunit [Planctomycetota bacterium]